MVIEDYFYWIKPEMARAISGKLISAALIAPIVTAVCAVIASGLQTAFLEITVHFRRGINHYGQAFLTAQLRRRE